MSVTVQDWKDGEVKIRGAVITKTSTGNSRSFQPQIISIDIYEAVDREFLVADILLFDGVGLIESLPIVGEETITLSFSTKTGAEFRQTFVVNEVMNVVPDREQTGVSYTLRCYSPHAMQNAAVRIYKKYTGTIADTVREVISNEIGFAGTVDITPTVGPQIMVSTGWRPFQFINFMKYRATSSRTEGSLFMSYYDRTGAYRFKTVEEMIAQPVGSKQYGRVRANQTNFLVSNENQILKLTFPRQQNTFEKIADGAFGTNVYGFDFFTKQLVGVASGVERNYLSTNPDTRGGTTVSPTLKASMGVRAAGNQLRKSILPLNLAPGQPATYTPEAISRKAQYAATLDGLALVEVYGDPTIGVGSAIVLNIHSPTPDGIGAQTVMGSMNRQAVLVMRTKHSIRRSQDNFIYKQTHECLMQGYAR